MGSLRRGKGVSGQRMRVIVAFQNRAAYSTGIIVCAVTRTPVSCDTEGGEAEAPQPIDLVQQRCYRHATREKVSTDARTINC